MPRQTTGRGSEFAADERYALCPLSRAQMAHAFRGDDALRVA